MQKAITLIPAIDIIDGKCVRLSKGDYASKKVYHHDPLEVARMLEEKGFSRLHLVDLDGAKKGQVQNWKVIEAIASKTKLIVDFGGGLRSREEVKRVLDSGVAMVTAGSIAVREPQTVIEWLQEFGGQRIILGADVRNQKVAIHGWKEDSHWQIEDLIETYRAQGIETLICTDIDRDGMLKGSNLSLYQKLTRRYAELNIIASGGVATIEDLYALQKTGVAGVIIGKALYEGTIKIEELTDFLC